MYKTILNKYGLILLLLISPTLTYAGWMDQFDDAIKNIKQNNPIHTESKLKPLTQAEIALGLKDALRVGSEKVVGQLSKKNAFNNDPLIHIPLPANMKRVKSGLVSIGMGKLMDDLELKLNHAAETATPKAKRIFGQAIQNMSINDAKNILDGPDDAATTYFKGKMSTPLSNEMRPVIQQALNQVGAIRSYESVMHKYHSLPFVPDIKSDLTQHVLDKALYGLFHYIAEEEKGIREDPAKRTTEILKKVFSN